MRQRIVLLWGLVTVAIAAVVGAIAYHAGQTTTEVVTQAPAGTAIYHGYYGGGGWFFGFFPILFFILLLVFLFRRPWGRGYYGHGAPHWHDHAHGGTGGTPTQPPAGPTNQPPAV
jgi:hypothetical protein